MRKFGVPVSWLAALSGLFFFAWFSIAAHAQSRHPVTPCPESFGMSRSQLAISVAMSTLPNNSRMQLLGDNNVAILMRQCADSIRYAICQVPLARSFLNPIDKNKAAGALLGGVLGRDLGSVVLGGALGGAVGTFLDVAECNRAKHGIFQAGSAVYLEWRVNILQARVSDTFTRIDVVRRAGSINGDAANRLNTYMVDWVRRLQ